MGILNSIRQRPDNQKKVFSLVAAIILTFFIVALWYSFSSNSSENQASGEKNSKLSSISPLQVIKDEFSKIFSTFNDDMSGVGSSTIPIEIIEATTTASSTENSTSNLVN